MNNKETNDLIKLLSNCIDSSFGNIDFMNLSKNHYCNCNNDYKKKGISKLLDEVLKDSDELLNNNCNSIISFNFITTTCRLIDDIMNQNYKFSHEHIVKVINILRNINYIFNNNINNMIKHIRERNENDSLENLSKEELINYIRNMK